MPFVFLIVGLVCVVSGTQNTQGTLFTQLKTDFTGKNNFGYWALSIFVIGAIGYVPELKTFSRWILALVLIGLIVSNKGFFAQFQQAIGTTKTASPNNNQSSPSQILEQ